MSQVVIEQFAGPRHHPGDAGYDGARDAHNRRFDAHPAMVAQATGAADVQAAVRAAREQGLPLGVQATGHGVTASADDGILLTLSRMNGIAVDTARRTVTVGPGAVWGDVVPAAAAHGLAPLPGTSPTVGVTGYTLGGGFGLLSRKFGLTADSVVRAQVVTADGRLLTAAADEHPDLFWALRGGGGNFGVVTELELRLHPLPTVYAGESVHDIERAPEVLARFAEWAGEQPDDIGTVVTLLQLPPLPFLPEAIRGKRVVSVDMVSTGDPDEAQRRIAPLLEVAGPPLLQRFGTMSYGDSFALLGPGAPPAASLGHTDLFGELSEGARTCMVEALGEGSPLVALEVRQWGGVLARPGPDAGPGSHPDARFSLFATGLLDRGPEGLHAGLATLADGVRPHATGETFYNFLADPSRVRSAFRADNWARLVAAKRAWDPDNLFRLNLNIPPD